MTDAPKSKKKDKINKIYEKIKKTRLAKCSPSEMLLLGFKAVWSTDKTELQPERSAAVSGGLKK